MRRGQGAQAGRGGSRLRVPAGALAQPCAGADQAGSGQAAKPGAEGVGCGDDQRVQLALGVGGGLDRRAPGGQPHLERRAMAGGAGWEGTLPSVCSTLHPARRALLR
jgi:hypothetical protein